MRACFNGYQRWVFLYPNEALEHYETIVGHERFELTDDDDIVPSCERYGYTIQHIEFIINDWTQARTVRKTLAQRTQQEHDDTRRTRAQQLLTQLDKKLR